MDKTLDILSDYVKRTLDSDYELVKENLRLKKENEELKRLLKENGVPLPKEAG